MRDRQPNPGAFELHLMPVDVIRETSDRELPPNMNRYLARAVEMDAVAGEKSAFVYAKLCKLILLGFRSDAKASRMGRYQSGSKAWSHQATGSRCAKRFRAVPCQPGSRYGGAAGGNFGAAKAKDCDYLSGRHRSGRRIGELQSNVVRRCDVWEVGI